VGTTEPVGLGNGDELQISIIMPSFNDIRIVQAIASVRRFDDIECTKLIVIDGGSRAEVLTALRASLTDRDILVSEPDRGIFDALNKGLDLVDTPLVGWLGADDLFTGQIKASAVVRALATCDLFIASLAMFRDDRVRRVFDSRVVELGLVGLGLHNPHFSTFGRANLLKAHRFPLTHNGSDIEYFIDVFATKPRVTTTDRIAVAMQEGGFSNASVRRIAELNCQLYPVYRVHNGALGAIAAIALKLGWKIVCRLRAIVSRQAVGELLVD